MGAKEEAKRIVECEERFVRYEWRRYNTILFFLVLLVTLESVLSGTLQVFLQNLGSYGYLGGILAGFFYTYGVTSPFSIATFFILAESLNPWMLAFLGALASLVSEFIIYDFSRLECKRLLRSHKLMGLRIPKIKSNILKKLSPILAGFIIASPLPDELAAVLLGSENYGIKKFMVMAFAFNFLGILIVIGLGRIF
jgi:hypothetical protein